MATLDSEQQGAGYSQRPRYDSPAQNQNQTQDNRSQAPNQNRPAEDRFTYEKMLDSPCKYHTTNPRRPAVVGITWRVLLMGLPGEAHDVCLKRTCGMGLLGSYFEYMTEAHVKKLDRQGRVRRSSNPTRVHLPRPGCLYKAREGAVVEEATTLDQKIDLIRAVNTL